MENGRFCRSYFSIILSLFFNKYIEKLKVVFQHEICYYDFTSTDAPVCKDFKMYVFGTESEISHTFQATVNELLSRGFSQETQEIRQKNMEAILYKDS